WQMSKYVAAPFPDEWKANFIEIKTTITPPTEIGWDKSKWDKRHNTDSEAWRGYGHNNYWQPGEHPVPMEAMGKSAIARAIDAARELVEDLGHFGLRDVTEVIEQVELVKKELETTVMGEIIDSMKVNEVS